MYITGALLLIFTLVLTPALSPGPVNLGKQQDGQSQPKSKCSF